MKGIKRLGSWHLAATLLILGTSVAATRAPHLELAKSDPVNGATVDSVTAIRLWFVDKPMEMGKGTVQIRILDSDGKVLSTGNPVKDKKDPKLYVLALPRKLEPRAYRVEWQTMADDGDMAKGEIRFTVKGG